MNLKDYVVQELKFHPFELEWRALEYKFLCDLVEKSPPDDNLTRRRFF